MSDYKDQKELKMAMNGRMGLMTGGIILLVTAVSSTLMYGINLFSIASGAAKGEQEYTWISSPRQIWISRRYGSSQSAFSYWHAGKYIPASSARCAATGWTRLKEQK
ncbi:MAG: hypothetical protein ACLTSZ_02780 [Lachnospiraceae bacterium]